MRTHQPLAPARSPKTVIVAGAGVAGLTCAYELVEAGHRVRVLEARDRPGGRVWTLREPFPAGLTAEVGATFLPDNHPLPLHYADALGLTLEPLPKQQRSRLSIGGRLVTPDGPVELNPDERGVPPFALLNRAVTAVADRLGGWPPDGDPGAWAAFDRITLDEMLRREGLSAGARALVGLTLMGNIGDGIATVSALGAIRQLRLQHGRVESYAVGGGNDRLATAFVDRLGDRVRFNAEVVGLNADAAGVTVRGRGPGGEFTDWADYLVAAVPTPALARWDATPAWTAERAEAIRRQRWTPVARVFLTVAPRFWPADHPPMLASSDSPAIRWMAFDAPAGDHGVLTAYVLGSAALALAERTPDERAAWTRAEAMRMFPEWDGTTVGPAVSHCWDADPFAGGGYPWPTPGDDALPDVLAAPVGRIHFAGEHTTRHFGWLQGAMESGLRAAHEVHAAP